MRTLASFCSKSGWLRSVLLGTSYSATGLAMCCWFGLHCYTGVIYRSARTCRPLPSNVLEKLSKGEPQDMCNELGENSSSYCVRCFVWRPKPIESPSFIRKCVQRLGLAANEEAHREAHHCSICQHCVLSFDHHCSVLGTCITSSNEPFFILLLALGAVAPFVLVFSIPAVTYVSVGIWTA